ncbi:DNA methyltransferase [Pilimelia terevasa]|uniref:DNA methyltransferase n=1 Tax=Pilimelia terevasa TaxID=53372 RepID=A0A8J3BIL0_9ACTN|nr:MGMT family protein [Pilimelia terevasa]GGK12905.1 DNA methyltransferase [Pilimelia terevasa]
MDAAAYVEAVLRLVEGIPAGRVATYGAVADALAEVSGRQSPRQVGTIMARYGGGVPWHRVVNAAGRVAPSQPAQALARLRAEGVPLRGDRVDLARAGWHPPPVR